MKYLLDTHVAIWALTDRARLKPQVLDIIADTDNAIFVSVVAIWEIAIKTPLNRERGRPPFSAAESIGYFHEAGFTLLDITPAHAAAVETLPPIHADPFDRLLVAQALTEPMRLVTADALVARYSDTIILAA